MNSNETVTIERCPICSQRHTFALAVQRNYVMKMMTMFNDSNGDVPRIEEYTRFFICPVKRKQFQATFSLTTIGSSLASVEVMGPLEENG